jgi:hypothetical protein
MERDLDELPPDVRAAIWAAGRMLDEASEIHSEFSFATLRVGREEHTACYVIKEHVDGSRNFEFEILID